MTYRHLRATVKTMRLLHVKADSSGKDGLEISLCEKHGADIPPYMILSHRWRAEEILFAEITNPDPSVCRRKLGWAKLESSCRIALEMGLEYVWIDTCCIDKSSSAELSDTINLMYHYYARSSVCVAYLDDAKDTDAISASIWFTRAWTLQELIAPKNLHVYSRGWQKLGTKASLSKCLSHASRVPEQVLLDSSCLEAYSASEKMYWTAWREATRNEDEAYSLLGIFGVTLTPTYGEGLTMAFRRLQVQILQHRHDHTVFAWGHRAPSGDMLASSARDFLGPYTYRRMPIETYESTFGLQEARIGYNMTDIGLQTELPVAPIRGARNMFLAFIACRSSKRLEKSDSYVAICLFKITSGSSTRWIRSTWNNQAILHFSDLRGIDYKSTELWISKINHQAHRPPRSSLTQSKFSTTCLIIDVTPSKVFWTAGLRHTATFHSSTTLQGERNSIVTSNNHSSAPDSFTLQWCDSPVQVIMFDLVRPTLHAANASTYVGLFLAFGEINGKRWIFPRHVKSSDARMSEFFETESAKLQRDCIFPAGLAWTASRPEFRYIDPLSKSISGSEMLGPVLSCGGSWSDQKFSWICEHIEGSRQLYIKIIRSAEDDPVDGNHTRNENFGPVT